MAELIAQTDVLRLALTTSEKCWALRRKDLTIPWAQVSGVEAVAEPYRLVRGWRAPGLSLPGRARIGTWRYRGRKTFVVAHRGRPGLRISLQRNNYQQLLIDVDDPAVLLGRLRERLQVDPTDAEGAVSDRPISFPSRGVTLAGSLRLPGTVRAAALLISGSGRLDHHRAGR